MACLLVACGGGSGSSSGGGSAGGGTTPSSSAPSGFTLCPQSGDAAKISDKDTAGEWQYQQQQGATVGDIEVYAASSGDCVGMPDIRPGSKKLMAGAVITYKDAASAAKGYGGLFGVNPTSISHNPGATTGAATGYGDNSVYSYASGESAAAWVNGNKVVAVIAENVSESDFKSFAGKLK